jgi:ABC-type glycerol-3-phosphate transport system substrate-binding protein
MTRPFFAVLLVLAFLRPAAAAPAARPSNAGPTLFHWWTSPSELAALDALIALFEKQYPDMKVTASLTDAHGGGGRLFSVIRTAATTANPPDAFQLHAGAPLRPYFDAGLVSAIDKLWIDEGLDRTVPPIVQSMSQIDGHYYAIPMNVHRNNLIWYNKALLDRHKIDPATLVTWEAFFEAAEKLKAAACRAPASSAWPGRWAWPSSRSSRASASRGTRTGSTARSRPPTTRGSCRRSRSCERICSSRTRTTPERTGPSPSSAWPAESRRSA